VPRSETSAGGHTTWKDRDNGASAWLSGDIVRLLDFPDQKKVRTPNSWKGPPGPGRNLPTGRNPVGHPKTGWLSELPQGKGKGLFPGVLPGPREQNQLGGPGHNSLGGTTGATVLGKQFSLKSDPGNIYGPRTTASVKKNAPFCGLSPNLKRRVKPALIGFTGVSTNGFFFPHHL